VSDEDQLAFSQARIHEEQLEHIGRAIGEMHRRAAPSRHRRFIIDGQDGEPFNILGEPFRPNRAFGRRARPCSARIASKPVHENHAGLQFASRGCQFDKVRHCVPVPRTTLFQPPPRP
jgi:hypothetical protein